MRAVRSAFLMGIRARKCSLGVKTPSLNAHSLWCSPAVPGACSHSWRASLCSLSCDPSMNFCCKRNFTTTAIHATKDDPLEKTSLTVRGLFNAEERTKKTFLTACDMFSDKGPHLRGHVEFIYSALSLMEEYGVHKDLEVYKKLLNLMPKGKMIPRNVFQAEFMHYPKQQQCAIDCLEQMETNGVMPDSETENILRNTFGKQSHPVRKYGRMMYWMPKFKNASPWTLPTSVPKDPFELAKIAVARMCTVDPTSTITVFQTSDVEDAVEDTWIVSGQSTIQQELLQKHPPGEPIKVEGPFRIHLREESIGYFVLRAEAKPKPPPPSRDVIDAASAGVDKMVDADSLEYSDMTEDDVEAVIDFMAVHFYPREPLSTGLHMTYEDNEEWIGQSVPEWVRSKVCVVARDPDTGKICGTQLGTILTREQANTYHQALTSPKTKVKTLHAVLNVLEAAVDFFELYEKVDRILELAMITVSAEVAGRGVGKRLVQESEKRGRRLGCQLATAQATAVPSQKMLYRLGYKTLYTMDYSTFEVAGDRVFDMDRMLGTPSAKVMARLLEPYEKNGEQEEEVKN